MKKIIAVVWILVCSVSAFGQETVDYLLKSRALTDRGKPDLAIEELTRAISANIDSRLFVERADAYCNKRGLFICHKRL